MPFAHSDGARIHYQIEGEGPPLVPLCGLPQSLDDWYELGYVAAFRDAYRVIALGQGRSDRPHVLAAYSAARRLGDVLSVLTPRASSGRTSGAARGARAPATSSAGMHPIASTPSCSAA